jgi:hypothetical protein
MDSVVCQQSLYMVKKIVVLSLFSYFRSVVYLYKTGGSLRTRTAVSRELTTQCYANNADRHDPKLEERVGITPTTNCRI